MAFCTKCGQSNQQGSRFCNSCGPIHTGYDEGPGVLLPSPSIKCLRCYYRRGATITTGKVSDACSGPLHDVSTVAVIRAVFVVFFGVKVKLSLLSLLREVGVRAGNDTTPEADKLSGLMGLTQTALVSPLGVT